MNYKDYIQTSERHELYSHAMKHSSLASKELFFDIRRMIDHIEFMHVATGESDRRLDEWIEEYRIIRDHPFRNLWNWTRHKLLRLLKLQ